MEKPIIPTYSLPRGDRAASPFRLVEMTPRKEGSYDYSRPHRHDYYEIFFFAEGSGEHDVDFNTFDISAPSLHFVSPGQIHRVRREHQSSGYVLLFTDDFYYLNLANRDLLHEIPLLNGNHERPVINLEGRELDQVLSVIRQIADEYQSPGPYSDDAIRSHLNLLLILSRRIFEGREGSNTDESTEGRLVRELRKQIDRNFHAIHAVSAYANLLNVSPGHLNDVTKGMTGKTASGLIQERLLLEARRLLAHSDHSIKEIAYALGFDDPSYFTRFFRERIGQAPGAFRNDFRSPAEAEPVEEESENEETNKS